MMFLQLLEFHVSSGIAHVVWYFGEHRDGNSGIVVQNLKKPSCRGRGFIVTELVK